MAVSIDDPDVIGSTRKPGAEMACPEEEAIGYAAAPELRLRRERPILPKTGAEAGKSAAQLRSEALRG